MHKVVWDFHDEDVQHVLQTRIHPAGVKYRIAWHYLNTGMYTVKTAYQFWLSQNNFASSILNTRSWNSIWKLQVPHKVRTFVWRFCNNSVPVRNKLRSRGVDIPIEHLSHIFFDCPFAMACWQKVGLVYAMEEVEFAPNWLLEKMATSSSEEKKNVAMTLWGIWFARNQKVWENKVINPPIAMEISMKQKHDWHEAMKSKLVKEAAVSMNRAEKAKNIPWKPPREEWDKLNIDASLFAGELSYNVGMVI